MRLGYRPLRGRPAPARNTRDVTPDRSRGLPSIFVVGTLQDASRTPAPPEGATRKIPPSARPTPSSHQRRPLTRAKSYSVGKKRQRESLLLRPAGLCMLVRQEANASPDA